MIDLFQIRFRNQVQYTPIILDLQQVRMNPKRNFIDYITRWTDIFSKLRVTPFKNQCVNLIMDNVDHAMKGWLSLRRCLNFPHLRDEGAHVHKMVLNGILQPNGALGTTTASTPARSKFKNTPNNVVTCWPKGPSP